MSSHQFTLSRGVSYTTSSIAAHAHWSVLETVVHSAALHSATLMSFLRMYVAGSNVEYVCLVALQPTIGITFTLIIILIGLEDTSSENSTLKVDGHSLLYPLRTLAVNVSVSWTYDRASFDVYELTGASTGGGVYSVDVESAQGGS